MSSPSSEYTLHVWDNDPLRDEQAQIRVLENAGVRIVKMFPSLRFEVVDRNGQAVTSD